MSKSTSITTTRDTREDVTATRSTVTNSTATRKYNAIEHYNAQKSFVYFCREVLGYKRDDDFGYKDLTKTHEELCKFLESKKFFSKLILMPRYTFKSGLITVGYILWRLVKNPNLRILIYSDSATKAQIWLSGIKNHIEGRAPNSKFRQFYPKWETEVHKGRWNDSQINVSARTISFAEPSIDTAGIETTKVGMHYDMIVFDDIVSDMNTTTKFQMDKVHECYKKALSLLKPDGDVVLLGTRWHFGDTYGRIIDENRDKDNFGIFIKDAESVGSDGKLLFEDIGLNRKFLDYQKAEQGSYLFSCLYRNSPLSEDTAMFKVQDFMFYEPKGDFYKNMFISASCDPAGEGEDYTAITVVGTDDKGNMYLLDAVNDHLNPHQIINTIIRLNYKWRFDRFAIEKNFFKGLLESELRKAITAEASNKTFKLFSVEEMTATMKQRTFNRILSLQPFHERHQIFFPGKTIESLPTVWSTLAYQMIQFTIDGSKSPNDDLLVSLSYHVQIHRNGGDVAKLEPPVTSAAWYEKTYMVSEVMERNSRIPLKYRKQVEMVFN